MAMAYPNSRDTDGDGADDGKERRTGTDPVCNGLIQFPEPMVFDMVRGLGAKKGEVDMSADLAPETVATYQGYFLAMFHCRLSATK